MASTVGSLSLLLKNRTKLKPRINATTSTRNHLRNSWCCACVEYTCSCIQGEPTIRALPIAALFSRLGGHRLVHCLCKFVLPFRNLFSTQWHDCCNSVIAYWVAYSEIKICFWASVKVLHWSVFILSQLIAQKVFEDSTSSRTNRYAIVADLEECEVHRRRKLEPDLRKLLLKQGNYTNLRA